MTGIPNLLTNCSNSSLTHALVIPLPAKIHGRSDL